MPLIAAIKRKIGIRKHTLEESSALYTAHSVFNLALSLIGIYLPLYIFDLSAEYSWFHYNYVINGIVMICSFYLLISVCVMIAIVLFEHKIFASFHLKKTLFLGVLVMAGELVAILLAQSSIYFLIPAAILAGIKNTFYWIPYHIFFIRGADDGDQKYGAETGKRGFMVGIAGSLGPFLGGLIIAQFGFTVLYILAIIILLSSVIPILLFVRENHHHDHRVKKLFTGYLFNKEFFPISAALSGAQTSATIFTIFWSLALYFQLKGYVEIGLLNTISGFLATILLLIIGKTVDLKGKSGIHSVGVFINTVLHLMRPFILGTSFIYPNHVIDKLNSPAYNIPFAASIYEKGLKKGVSDFIVYREWILHAARFVLLAGIIAAVLITGSWTWVFFIGAFGSALTFLVNS